MQDFDPLEWFAGLDEDARADVVRHVVAAFEGMDPGFATASGMWRRGKTARVEVTVPSASPRPFGVHLSVEGANPRLLANLIDRARRGDLVFAPSIVQNEAGGTTQGLVASMGVGAAVVTSRLGELVLTASATSRTSVPVGDGIGRGRAGIPLVVGSRFPVAPPEQEGFVLMLFEGQLVGVGNFGGLGPRDARLFGTAQLRVGLARATSDLMLLCIDIKGFRFGDGWFEMPFAIAVERPEQRRLAPPDGEGRMSIVLILVDRDDGTVRALRPVRLSKGFSATLLDTIDAQQDAQGAYDMARYAADYAAATRRWPTPAHIERDMVAKEYARGV